MVDGYKIPITADDADSLVQRKSKRVSHAALAQVATKVPTTGDESWLCDVRGEDGKPFYVANYDEYHHCASMFRVTADDNLHHAPASMAQITGVRVSNQALAQVATMTKVPTTGDVNWLCDVRGDDGKPFYLQSYGEYAHCAELGRMNTNDILH